MKFSLRWLGHYLDLHVSPSEMLEKLTLAGTEVEAIRVTGVESPHVVVARILSSIQHPNADRLRICQVEDGSGVRQIVCGAKNYHDGDKVPLALPGAQLPGGLVIKESKLRGELSQGMLCSAKELSLAEDAEGLLLLPPNAPVGQVFSKYQPGDTVFEVEITSNRPDLLSYRGMAREIAAIGTGRLKVPPFSEISFPFGSSSRTVRLTDVDRCPFYTATHLRGVKVQPSPLWLQEAIAATGHRPINNVVDITNFVLFETGQPLHAFDAAQLAGASLEIRRARAGEKLEALDDRTYELLPDDLVIADEKVAVAIAGVMGGKPTGVTETTTEIVLEAAWFFPATVQRTSRRLGLMSDSSYRYERRVDPGALLVARDRALALLKEITGGVIVSPSVIAGAPPAPRGPISLRVKRVEKLLGIPINEESINESLARLGCVKVGTEGAVSTWQPPTFRDDLVREVDLIEEIARLRGLESVPSRLKTALHLETEADRAHDRLRRLRECLADRGWDECVTDTLIERRFATQPAALEMANPLSELQTHLRPQLKTSLLQVAARNLARGVDQLCLFEVGQVFKRVEKEVKESRRLGLLQAGTIPSRWFEKERSLDFFDFKGNMRFLIKNCGFDLKVVGQIELINPTEAKIHGIKIPIYYAELDLDLWLTNPSQPERYRALPTFPSSRRDLAVVVPHSVAQADVEKAIWSAKSPHLESVQLFDLFRDDKGEKIAADRKSLAYALTYRASDHTLTEKEINEAQERIRQKLVVELSCTFRE